MKRFMTYNICYEWTKPEYIHYNPYRSVNENKKFIVKERRPDCRMVIVEPVNVPLTKICDK